MSRLHQNNFATNLTSNQIAGVTTTPLNSIPSIAAPFYLAFDATNLNGKYEVVDVTSKTATHVNHAATTYAHTTAEEVRMVVPAEELDAFSVGIFGQTADGWTAVSDTWTYASASTITVPSGAASLYQKGDRIKFTQTTVKYGVIVAVADTLLTILVNTDYVVANAAITNVYYSHVVNPIGYPKWFALAAPSFTVGNFDNGSGGQPTVTEHRASITGSIYYSHLRATGTKATTNNLIDWTSPTAVVNSTNRSVIGNSYIQVGVASNYPGIVATISTTSFYAILSDSITDNATVTDFAFNLSFEI